MNVLDRVIAAIAPSAGERRVKARARMKAVMNYDAATKGRRTYGWKAPATNADAASQAGRGQMRNLSRDMIRNRAAAARAQMVVTANVVGTGIMPSIDAENPEVKGVVDEVVQRHLLTRDIDAYGEQDLLSLQRTVMNAVFSDGEVLVRRRLRSQRFSPGLALPFQVQLLEPDHLDVTKQSHGKNRVVDGIEFGPTGSIEAYHLFDEHPGGTDNWSRRKLESRRVAAQSILHIRRQDRPGQLRGVPWLAPVMMILGELSDYQEAQILKQRMAALMAVIVTTDDAGEKFNGGGLDELAPGAVVGLEPGQDVSFTSPPTVDGYGEFMKQGLAAIATGIGITNESLSGDLSGTNFTSFRAGRMEMDRLVETWQQQIMIAQFCEGISRWVNEAWPMNSGQSGLMARARNVAPEDFRIMWTAPRRALVDPNKEIPAVLKSIDGGLTSRQRAQRQLGLDPDLIRRERIEDNDKDAAAGLAPGEPGGENK